MPKNLIFILSDQHRWDVIGTENHQVKTPNLNRMAQKGIQFDQCFCSTQPCVPSRASILTGRYHEEHGMKGNGTVLGRYEKTWAQHLSENGYQTVAVGRTHDIDKGFHNVIRVPSGDSYPINCHDPKLQLHWRKDAYIGPSPAPFEEYYETKITKTALEFLREMKRGEEPFALYIGYLQPHAAFTPPEPYWSMYQDLKVDLPTDSPPPEDMLDKVKHYAGEVDEEKYQQIVRGYYAMVSSMDACIGMVLDEVEKMGIAEDTLVVYTSDHGEMLGNKGLHSKGYGYDPSFRVPLLAMCPGTIPEQTRSSALVEQVDLANTIMDALGLERMPTKSKSVWHVMNGSQDNHREWIYSTLGNGFVCRSDQYKWIHRVIKNESIDEIYDISHDPRENQNIAADAEGYQAMIDFYPKVINHMVQNFRRPITDFDPEAIQPRLLPFFTK
jgi:choline-sulfatase